MGLFDDIEDAAEDVAEEAGKVVDDVTGGGEPEIEADEDTDVTNVVVDEDASAGEAADAVEAADQADTDDGDVVDATSGNDFSDVADTSVDVDSGGGGSSGSSSTTSSRGTSSSSSSGGSAGKDAAGSGGEEVPESMDAILREGETDKRQLPDTLDEVERAEDFRDDRPLLRRTTPEAERFLDARRQNLETRRELQRQENLVRSAPEGVRFESEGQTFTRDEALQEIEEGQERVENVLRENEETAVSVPDRRVPGFDNDPTEGALGDFFNPNRQVDEEFNAAGEAVIAGQDAITESEEFAEDVVGDSDVGEFLGANLGGGIIAGAELAGRGKPGEGVKSVILPGAQNELEAERGTQIAQGIVSGPGALGGFIVGGAGAVGKTAEQEVEKFTGQDIAGGQEGPGFGGSLAQGGSRIARKAADDPGKFVAEEGGEEIGEGIATAGIGLAAPTITPDVTVEVGVPDSLQTTANFVKGDLGLRAEDPRTKFNLADTEILQREFSDLPGGREGRAQIVRGFRLTEGGTKLETGFGLRREIPMTRREFLKERLGLSDAKLADALEPNALGVGPGALLPKETTPDSTVDTRPESEFEPEDLFDDTMDARPEPLPDSIEAPFTSFIQSIGSETTLDSSQEEQLGFDQFGATRLTPVLDTETTLTNSTQTFFESEFRPEQQRTLESNRRVLGRPSFDDGLDDFILDDSLDEGGGADLGAGFTPSVTAQLFNIRRSEDFDEEEFVGTGLEVRGLPPLDEDLI